MHDEEIGSTRNARAGHRRAVEAHLDDLDFETALEHPRPDKKRKIFYGNSSYLEDPCDSDTDTTISGNNSSLSKLLSAVESVLHEERSMDTVRTELKRVRGNVIKIDAARKVALEEMERWVNAQLDYLQRGIVPARAQPGMHPVRFSGPSFSALDALSSVAGGGPSRSTDNMQVDSVVKPETDPEDAAVARREEDETALVAQETVQAATTLRTAVESAYTVQSAAVMDLEQLRSKFALMLVEFRQKMTLELSSINENLAAVRSRPNSGEALTHEQLAQVNQEVHALNMRMQQASISFHNQFMQLSQLLTERLESAKQTIAIQLKQHQRFFEDTVRAEERRMQAQLDALRMQVVSQIYPFETRLHAAAAMLENNERV